MSFLTPHNIFIDRSKVTRLDGTDVSLADHGPQTARTVCQICGDAAICDAWPGAPWRHMTQAETEQYGTAAPVAAEGGEAS